MTIYSKISLNIWNLELNYQEINNCKKKNRTVFYTQQELLMVVYFEVIGVKGSFEI